MNRRCGKMLSKAVMKLKEGLLKLGKEVQVVG